MTNEMHKDVQELWEAGVDVAAIKDRSTYLTDGNNQRWKYKESYNNPVGVEVIVLTQF